MKETTTKSGQQPLYGLLLTGGKSTRMGSDKSLLEYHGMPHYAYLFQLLDAVCDRTFLSLREDQLELAEGRDYILDRNQFRGPFNGMLSAHQEFPEVSWLVLACDLPLMDKSSLQLMIENHRQANFATALATHKTGLPEPLAAIWTSEALQKATEYLPQSDSSCPRKFLLQHSIKLVTPLHDDVLINANDKEEFQQSLKKVKST
ncbi:MAG: NTP transferase domain-containing protein [Bacteroidia bacterium]|nr:NTP transferase domain-containing protein [Bacteroidia bacterium]